MHGQNHFKSTINILVQKFVIQFCECTMLHGKCIKLNLKTDNVHINVIFRRVRLTVFAVKRN